MPDVYTLASTISLAGRARGGEWSDQTDGGVIKREIAKAAPPYNGWVWTHDPAHPAVVKDIWYQDGIWKGWNDDTFVPGHRYKVFDHIAWRAVGVVGAYDDPATPDAPAWGLTEKYPGDQELRGLPLTADHLVGRFTLLAGAVETSDLWPLPANIDSAVVLLFAYELRFKTATGRRTGACDVVPVAAVDYKHSSFMRVDGVEGIDGAGNQAFRKAVEGVMSASGTGQSTEVQLSSPRVLVVLTFTGCEPRADYEPGEIVTMARAHPHAYVLSSIPMHQTMIKVEVKRPTKSSMYEPPASDSTESHTEKIKTLLVADTNDRRGAEWLSLGVMPTVPYWYNMFDYYRVMGDSDPGNAARGQSFAVVRRTKGARTLSGAAGWQSSSFGAGPDGFIALDIEKVARQGAYDNIHMSPRMVAPEALMARYPALREHLMEVAQAPFCDCDCLHMHWRWGAHATKKSNQGWSKQGPHTQAGAPMVPLNQTVRFFTDSDSQFTYVAYARPTEAAKWQVFVHHGMALALAIGESWGAWVKKIGAGFGVNTLDVTDENLELPWGLRDGAERFMSVFYYRMRYHTNQGAAKAIERLAVLDRARLEDE